MNILVTLDYYHPHWTGLTAYAKRIAEGLAGRGHRVTVLAAQHKRDLPLEEEIGGVRVVRVPYLMRFSRGVIMPDFPRRAAQLIAQNDIVHIHSPMPETIIVTALARALGKPSLVTHQGDLVMPAGLVNRMVQQGERVLTAGVHLSDRVIVHSADYARNSRFLQQFGAKVGAIYPPADIPLPQPDVIAAWKDELGLADRRLVGFAGRFVEEKGFDFLMQAIPLVRARVPEAHFVFAGEINVAYEHFFQQWRHLFEQQREHITPVGLITDPQKMANFYAMCDLFALPSRTDCFPSVQIEALLSGTPLVTTDIPGAREVLQVSGMGVLVAPRDPQALADGIVEVLCNTAAYKPTRADVTKIFSVERALNEYEAEMEQLVRASPAYRRAEARRALEGAAPPPGSPARPILNSNGAHAPGLSADDRATLERLLKNEADMAFRRRALSLLGHLELRDGDTVLDCGCGMGVYLMMMRRLRDIKLVGVDGDVSRLAWAESEAVAAHLSSVDIHQLPFPDGTFDRVLMSEVLEHIADDRQAMREVFRVLKPGGILALSVPHADYPFWWDPINKTLEAVGARPIRKPGLITGLWSNHWRLYRPAELADVISGAGFSLEALEEQTHYSFPFIHLAVYSVGKPLIEHNLLPEGLRNSADRFRGERNSGSLLNPINAGVRLFRMFDAPNERLDGSERTFVNIVVKARKPG